MLKKEKAKAFKLAATEFGKIEGELHSVEFWQGGNDWVELLVTSYLDVDKYEYIFRVDLTEKKVTVSKGALF